MKVLLKYPLFILVCVDLLLTGSCKKRDVPVAAPSATLKSTAPFPVGAAVLASLLKNHANYRAVVNTEYNSITTGNELKFDWIEPQQGQFNYTDGDYIITFAQQYHKRVHAHN